MKPLFTKGSTSKARIHPWYRFEDHLADCHGHLGDARSDVNEG
jgi:hypothetical protein